MNIKAVIFDLDGVIVSTDDYHYSAWKKMADGEGIYFDKEINENLRGVSRMESLEIILKQAKKMYTEKEKLALAQIKNDYYKDSLENLKPNEILPGVIKALDGLKQKNIKIAIGSSSKNTPLILKQIGLENNFDVIADGNQIKNSKPDPEVFLLAADKLGIVPKDCLVVEDADAGIEAAIIGGMKVLGVGSASNNSKANYGVRKLSEVTVEKILNI